MNVDRQMMYFTDKSPQTFTGKHFPNGSHGFWTQFTSCAQIETEQPLVWDLRYMYSAHWVIQSTTGLKPMDCINQSGLIKGSEVSWLILQSQIVIRLNWSYETLIALVLIQKCFATWFKPHNALLHSMFLIPLCIFLSWCTFTWSIWY